MKIILISLLLVCNLISAEKVLAGYLPSYRIINMERIKHLNCLILFSAIPQPDGNLEISSKLKSQLEQVKNFKMSVYLTVGGWGKSSHFPAVSKGKISRSVFVKKVKSVVKKYGLAGVDYDWEHPKGKTEEKAYCDLIKETSEAGVKVTVAAAGWQKFDSSVFKYIQRLNLMSYDHEKEHATLEKSIKDVENFVKMGCPAEKICLGVPFYGRHIEKRDAQSYVTFASKLNSAEEDLYEGYYFNNKKTLIKKAAFAKEKKLAGIMIWEIEQDDPMSTLLKAIRKELLPEKN